MTDKAQQQTWRTRYRDCFGQAEQAFLANPDPQAYFKQHTHDIDHLLKDVCTNLQLDHFITLVAVGGYGRGEMYPHSDVDLLILLPDETSPENQQAVEQFIGVLWDLGLNVGHSVRTLGECISESQHDVTIMTNLLEARFLTGLQTPFVNLVEQLRANCDVAKFYADKLQEQQQRYAKFNDTAYNLEPNIKESPGGLRDLHLVIWLAKSLQLGHSWQDLVQDDLLNAHEARRIKRAFNTLQIIRIRLHLISKRREDRLLFDFQNAVAEQSGLKSNVQKSASEQLMQGFYRSAKIIIIDNEVILKSLRMRLALRENAQQAREYINDDFYILNGELNIADNQLFAQKPKAILQCFLLLQQHTAIKGFSAPLIRALQIARKYIDSDFRQKTDHKQLFLQILSEPSGVSRCLRRMNRYGILGRYIPTFGRIVGQMQHDLFHVYTVDEHILNVLRNLRRFTKSEFHHEFPLCSDLFSEFSQPQLLYLAAIFHDIAKGRGGDHSTLGTVDARKFCRLHGLNIHDTELVAWLVDAHLKMSSTAQKRDLSDPEVITEFAELVQTEERLIALYLLTVADIRGTSPNVWNAWKARLLENLFLQTRRVLQESLNSDAQLALRKQEVIKKLHSFNMTDESAKTVWESFGNAYFSRFDSDEIAWQTRLLIPHLHSKTAIVRARLSPKGDGIQVMIFSPDQSDIFARICHFFESMHYNVAQAKIFTTTHGYALDNFIVLESDTKQISYNGLLKHIEQGLTEQLKPEYPVPEPMLGRVSRQVKHMPITTQVNLHSDVHAPLHELFIIASDRPGLLAQMAHILMQHQVALHNAKINTLGNRVEDSFLISAKDGLSLNLTQLQALESAFKAL